MCSVDLFMQGKSICNQRQLAERTGDTCGWAESATTGKA